MSLDPSKRMRLCTTKSRNGCLPCKQAHVKCDEARPVCNRCTRKGRDCAWAVVRAPRARIGWRPESSLSLLPELNTEDRIAFDYFTARTVKQLIGTWGTSNWTPAVLQVAMSDTAVQRASIALGALHHVHELGRGCQQYGLSQYIGALGIVRDSLYQLKAATQSLLLVCVLFCAFECMSYHIDSAMSHLRSAKGLVLGSAWGTTKGLGSTGSELTSFLLPVLTHLENDYMCLGAIPSSIAKASLDIPKIFDSAEDAQQSLTEVLNLSHRQLAAVAGGELPLHHEMALQKAEEWMDAFDRWLAVSISSASDEALTTMLSMAAWRIFMEVIQSADHRRGPMAWDQFQPSFKQIVELAERFVDMTAESVSESELWKHPASYIKESAHERSQHTLSIERGGQITEGSLASFMLSRTPPARLDDSEQALAEHPAGMDPISALLQKSHSVIDRKRGSGRAAQAMQGKVQIRSVFTLSQGIVYPLFAVVCHCRHPPTRNHALRLLEVCNRHEGLWDSVLTAQSLRRRVMVEETQALLHLGESAAPADAKITSTAQIPNHCRVRATGRRFLPDGTVLERYCLGWEGSLESALASGQKERWIELRVAS